MKFGRFLHPGHEGVAELNERFETQLATTTVRHYIDVDAAFDNAGVTPESILTGNNDGHWNAAGHRHVADILREYLAGSGLLSLTVRSGTRPIDGNQQGRSE